MSTIESKRTELEAAVATAIDAVSQSERAVAAARQGLETAQARLEGFLAAIDLAPAPKNAVKVRKADVQRTRRRRLTGHWQKIMQHVPPDNFGYAELEQAGVATGHDVNRESLRSQMSGYKTAGIVEAAGEGKFRLTPYGKSAAGIQEYGASQNENGAAEAAPDADEVTASSTETGGENAPLFR